MLLRQSCLIKTFVWPICNSLLTALQPCILSSKSGVLVCLGLPLPWQWNLMAPLLCVKQNDGNGGGQRTFCSSEPRWMEDSFLQQEQPMHISTPSLSLESMMFQNQWTHRHEKCYEFPFQDCQQQRMHCIYFLYAVSLHHLPICSSGYISYRHQSTLQSQWVFSKRLSKTSRVTWRSSTISDFELLSYMCTLTTSWVQSHRRVS